MMPLRSIILAFSAFSRIPMPRVEWNRENMRYAMAALPLVGAAVGAAAAVWGLLAAWIGAGPFLRGAGFAFMPVLVCGGIHMDGFCDVVDALASRGDRERKRAILKDPHIGSFAAAAAALYFLLFAALAGEIGNGGDLACLSLLFVISRALSGLGVVCLPCAWSDGLGRGFRDAAAGRTSVAVLAAVVLAAGAGSVVLAGAAGVAALAGAALAFAWQRRIAVRDLGGNSGDLAGWFVQVCELASLAGLALAHKAAGV